MGFKPFTPSRQIAANPETYVFRKGFRKITKLNAAAIRALGGKDGGGHVRAWVKLYVDAEAHQVGFEVTTQNVGVCLSTSNGQSALNQAMEAAGLKPDVYALEKVDLLPVTHRIRGKVRE